MATKYALFEFPGDKSCEIGEARWITREDPHEFDNDVWDNSKEVMVLWPCDSTRISRINKYPIDPTLVETETCIAKVIKFSCKYIFYSCTKS